MTNKSDVQKKSIDEADVKLLIADAIAEYDKRYAEKSVLNVFNVFGTFKAFVIKHFQTIIIVFLMVYAFGGAKLFENFIGKMFTVQVNNALIQRVITDKTDRTRFVDRIRKLFDREYVNEDQFESDYRQTTADFRYKYPALRAKAIRNKKQLTDFIGEE
jgi:hypothetical protein